jgi:hypothetical protein
MASSTGEPAFDSVYLLGRVLPDTDLTIPSIPKIASKMPDGTEIGRYDVNLEKSILTVHCEVANYTQARFENLVWSVSEICQSFVDLTALTQGIALNLVIDQFIDPNGNKHIIKPLDPNLKRLATFPFPQAFEYAITNWHVRWALQDVASTLLRPNLTGTNCARAIERIARAIFPTDDKKKRWEAIQNHLRCSAEYLQFITDVSKSPRHGGVPEYPSHRAYEARQRAWTIINRYMEYLKRGGENPLPENEFPTLE